VALPEARLTALDAAVALQDVVDRIDAGHGVELLAQEALDLASAEVELMAQLEDPVGRLMPNRRQVSAKERIDFEASTAN
jgi:hypothetical protein